MEENNLIEWITLIGMVFCIMGIIRIVNEIILMDMYDNVSIKTFILLVYAFLFYQINYHYMDIK